MCRPLFSRWLAPYWLASAALVIFSAWTLLAQNPESSSWPPTAATDTDLLVLANSAQTTLNGAINSSTLTIVVTSAAAFVTPTAVRIDNEFIKICSVATNTFTACTGGRGQYGSSAASHSDAATVSGYFVAYITNKLAAEIKALQGSGLWATAAFGTDNRLLRSDGTGRGVQHSGITVDDSNNVSGIGTLSVTSTSTGSSPPSVTVGTGGVQAMGEGTVPSAGAAASVDICYADSTAHGILCSFNNGAYSQVARYADKLNVFGSTSSTEFASVLNDESGSSGGFLRAGRTLTGGAGIGTIGDLSADRTITWDPSTFVSSITLWDGASASRTLTANLSGTDPVITFSSNTVNISTGAFQVGGVAVALQSLTLTGGAGIAAIGDLSANRTISVDSTEQGFLTSGALTCGASTNGKMQVHTTPLQYCDNSGTPTLRYSAYGDSAGNATGFAAASDTASGIVELATISETTAGSDAARAVTPDGLAGSTIFGTKVVEIEVFPAGTNAATGDGKAYFRIPAALNGMNLISVKANVYTAGTTGTINIDIARCAAAATGNVCSGTVADVLSTNITIDSGENSTSTAATAAVIDTANDDVATDQVYRIDIDAVHTTPSQGLIVELTFQLP